MLNVRNEGVLLLPLQHPWELLIQGSRASAAGWARFRGDPRELLARRAVVGQRVVPGPVVVRRSLWSRLPPRLQRPLVVRVERPVQRDQLDLREEVAEEPPHLDQASGDRPLGRTQNVVSARGLQARSAMIALSTFVADVLLYMARSANVQFYLVWFVARGIRWHRATGAV